MKKSFRFMIIALFAVVSLNASAYSWPFWCDQIPNQYHNSGFWMEANSCREFTVNAYADNLEGYAYDSSYIRVGWYGSMYQDLLPGDEVYIVGYYYDAHCFVGTQSTFNDLIPVKPDGTITIRVCSGQYAGWRMIGPNGPIVLWPPTWLLESQWTGN